MESLACLNGELMPVDQARVPIWDRGFLFGDAVYEVFRLYEGRCWLEDSHVGRLRRSLESLEFAPFDCDALMERVYRTIRASGIGEGTLYVHITRGVAPRSHAFPEPPVPPTELIIVRVYDDAPTARKRASGVAVVTRPDLRWKRCDIKSTNLLANVLALQSAHRLGCEEAVLFGADGLVTEATHSSVIWVRGGRLEGTPEGTGILPGTTRGLILKLAEEIGIPFSGAELTVPELKAADEVFLVGTSTEILPVVTIDDAPVSGGRPGPVARRLQEAYRKAVAQWLTAKPA
ncbi:MAG: aminotransferase class IV [Isosphaeraceae bacterium]|nr:aminotransferase class IV [Isosphaeraceae bacterium]